MRSRFKPLVMVGAKNPIRSRFKPLFVVGAENFISFKTWIVQSSSPYNGSTSQGQLNMPYPNMFSRTLHSGSAICVYNTLYSPSCWALFYTDAFFTRGSQNCRLSRFLCSLTDSMTDQTMHLRVALKERDVDEAWVVFKKLQSNYGGADSDCLNHLLTLLVCETEVKSLLRAHSLLSLVKDVKLFDGDSIAVLALSCARSHLFEKAADTVRVLVRNDFFPPLAGWIAVLELLCKKPSGALLSIALFFQICDYVKKKSTEDFLSDEKFGPLLVAMKPDREAFGIMLEACALVGGSFRAERIISKMAQFDVVPDDATFRVLIKVYKDEGNLKELKSMLSRVMRAGIVPTQPTLAMLVSACISLQDVSFGAQLALTWINVGLSASIVSVGMMEEAFRLWGKKSLQRPNTEIFVCIVKGFLEKAWFEDAAAFLIELDKEGMNGSLATSVIKNMLESGSIDDMRVVMQEMASRDCPADLTAYISLIESYSRVPDPSKVQEVLEDDLVEVGYRPNTACYAALITSNISLCEYSSALLAFKRMRKLELTPLEPTFDRLLWAFKAKKKPSLMRKLLETSLVEPPLAVELRHWNDTIESYCDCGMLFHAKDTMKRMRELCYCPDATTYGFILNGYCAQGGKTEEILMLWLEVLEKENVEQTKLTKQLLRDFLFAFVRYGFFGRALEVVTLLEKLKYKVNKDVYKGLYYKHHQALFLGKHTSQERINKSKERRQHVYTFKSWLGI